MNNANALFNGVGGSSAFAESMQEMLSYDEKKKEEEKQKANPGQVVANEVVRPELPPADNKDRLALPSAKEGDFNRLDLDSISGPTDGDLRPVSDDPALKPLDPLVAGNVSRDAELKNAAKDIGERQLQKEVEEAKGIKGFFIKRWKNNYARKYYEKKYEKQAEAWIAAMERGYAYDKADKDDRKKVELASIGENVVLFDEDGNRLKRFEMTADDWQLDRKSSVERVVNDDLDDFQDYLSAEAGEEKLPENKELTQITRSIIEDFVKQVQNEPDRRAELEANMRAAMHNLSHMGSLARKAAGVEVEQKEEKEKDVVLIERYDEKGQPVLQIERDEDGQPVYEYEEDDKGHKQKHVKYIRGTRTFRREIPKVQLGNLNNYAEVAITALDRVEHGYALEDVMEGFKVVNARVNEGARTERHRDAVEKITDRLINGLEGWEGSRFGHLVPPEIIAGAVGMAGYFAKSFATSAVKAATFGLAGSAVTGVAAGMREHAHMTSDRQRMLRDMSGGLVKEGDKSKYEAKLFGTAYEMRSADDLVEAMNAAEESGDFDAIMQSLVEVEARRQFSDSEKKDLISYSNPEARSKEYLGLMMKMSKLKKAMTPEQREQFNRVRESMIAERREQLSESTDAKDQVFAKVRRRQAVKQGVKTGVVAFGSMVVSQEVLALIDPGKYGALESVLNKNGVMSTANNADATETMLAGFTGQHQEMVAGVRDGGTIDGTLSEGQKAALKERGGDYHEYKVPTTNTETHAVTHVGGEEVPGVSGRYLTEDWGTNGTTGADGNELGIWSGPRPGTFVTHMSGDSWTEMHGAMNFEDDVANGRLMGYLTVDRGAQAVRIPIPAEVTEDGQLLFDNPILRQFVGPDGEFHGAFFEVAKETGVDENGVTHLISYATEVGDGLQSTYDVSETVEVVTEQTRTAILEPAAEVTGENVAWGPFAAFMGRRGMSRMTRYDDDAPRGTDEVTGNRGEQTELPGSGVEQSGNAQRQQQFDNWWAGQSEQNRATYRRLVSEGLIDESNMLPEDVDTIRDKMYGEWWDSLSDDQKRAWGRTINAEVAGLTGDLVGSKEENKLSSKTIRGILAKKVQPIQDDAWRSVLKWSGVEVPEDKDSESNAESVGNAGYGGKSDFMNTPIAAPIELPSGIVIPDDIRAGWDREWNGNPDDPGDNGMSEVWKHSYLADDDWLNRQTETYRASDGIGGYTGEQWVNMRRQYFNEKRREAKYNIWWSGLNDEQRRLYTDLVMGTGEIDRVLRVGLQSVLDGMPEVRDWIRKKVEEGDKA